ncbi:MAG: hypothetical protein OEZ48_17050, partial [Candidatus Bathyarchaeota archaeon]|nr:hypothetical protein [Candidatus Bathyarchaeota archaeon]
MTAWIGSSQWRNRSPSGPLGSVFLLMLSVEFKMNPCAGRQAKISISGRNLDFVGMRGIARIELGFAPPSG